MTTMMKVKKRCVVCGNESDQRVLTSTNRFGSPDLDLRPPEMKRSTMPFWLQECPHCGYVSAELGQGTRVNKKWLSSESYTTCDGLEFQSDLAEMFYKSYMINVVDRNEQSAFFSALHAAWACDDSWDKKNAVHCRKLALNELEKVIEKQKINNEEVNEQMLLIKADLLRRTGQFEVLAQEFSDATFSTKVMQDVIAFQIAKAAQEDTGCYTVKQAQEFFA